MALTDCKALLPICSDTTVQKLNCVEKNDAKSVVHSLLEEILVSNKVEISQPLKRAVEVASHYVEGLYLAFLDQEILYLVSDFILKNLDLLVNSLKRFLSDLDLLCTAENEKGILSSKVYYACHICRCFIKMISHTANLRKLIEKVLDIAKFILDAYKQIPSLGYPLSQIIFEVLESGAFHYIGPIEAERLFTFLLNFLKYSITVNNDVQVSCLVTSILSMLIDCLSFPSMKTSFGSRLAAFVELLFDRNFFSHELCGSGREGLDELLLKLTIPLLEDAYHHLSSLSSSSLLKILYLQTASGYPVCYSNDTYARQKNYEIHDCHLEPMKKRSKSYRPANLSRAFYQNAEHVLRLLSHVDAELSALEAQIYEIGAISAVQRLSVIGTSLRYLKQVVEDVNHLLTNLIFKYRSLVSDGFRIVLDRVDPCSSVALESVAFLKDLIITLDCLSSISEDENAKHIIFPVLELGLNVLNNLRFNESSMIEYICSQFTEICISQLSSCQVADAKAAMNFINFVVSVCSKMSLSKSITCVDAMYFLILERSLGSLSQIKETNAILHDNLFSYLDLHRLNTWLNSCCKELNDHHEMTVDEMKRRCLFYFILAEALVLHFRFSGLFSFGDQISVNEILHSLEMSWETFFDICTSKWNDLIDVSHSTCVKKYTFSVMKFCVKVYELYNEPHHEEKTRLISRNLQYSLYISLVLGMEEIADECILKVVNILATLDCFSSSSVSVGPFKGIRCFSCLRSSNCSKLRSLELSFQCSGLCNLVTLLISEKFLQSEHFSFVVWGRLVSYLLRSFWCNYFTCNDSTSYHMEFLVVILLDSLISSSMPKLLQDICFKPIGSIDFKSTVKLSIDSREANELESFEVLFRVASEHSLQKISSDKVVSWFLRLFRDRLTVIGFYRLVNDSSEIYGWQSLFQNNTKDLWNIVASNVLRILLVENDLQSAEFLANQCGRSLCLLVKENLGSIVATYLYQRTILEANISTQCVQDSLVRLETCIEFCRKVIDCPSFAQLFLSCKISATKFLVQRLCKPTSELIFLEKSLENLAKLTGHCTSCSLISECFLALIDDLNQRIFRSLKYSSLARARSLKCLQRLFTFISSELHLFIPKILASLKLVLELEEELISVGIETWISFLNHLNPSHAGSHVLTILSVLNPFIPSFPEQLGPPLARLVSQSNVNLFLIIDESYIPTELASQVCFEEFFKGWRAARESLSLQEQMDMLASVIQSPEVPTVKYVVLSRLQKLVTMNRNHIIATMIQDLKMRSTVSAIISNLFQSLKSFDRKCCILAADILGDLGAIDPLYLIGDNAPVETTRYISSGIANNKIDSLENFLQALICQYLIPCLKEGEKSGTGLHQNVVGFALQELIRIYINECQQSPEKDTNNLETFFSSDLYISLAEDHRDLLIPYIHSSYSVVQTGHKKESLKLDEILDSRGVGPDALDLWISNLCILLVDTDCFLNTKSPWSRVLQVCRNVYRLHPQISRFVFPYILRHFLENLSDEKTEQVALDFIDSEICCALERGSIFASWVLGLVEEYRLIEETVAKEDKTSRLEKICARLNAFGGEFSSFQRNVLYKFLKNINDMDLAKASLKIGSYHRAIFYMEEHLRNFINCERLENATLLVRSLQDAYNAIGDKDSLLGLLVLQKKKLTSQLSLQEQILEAESLENVDEVSALYNEALSSKCLTGLEISYVKHLLKLNLTEHAKYYAGKFSSILEGTNQEQMRALHCAAAWRLSEWSEVDSLDSYPQITGEEEIGEICIAAYLNSLSSPSLGSHINNLAKERIMKSMADPSLGSYEKSYMSCVYLSILREIEWMKEILENSDKCRDTEKISLFHQDLTRRLKMTVPDVTVREPIVEARRVCYNYFGDNYHAIYAMMELSKLQKENGCLHAAYLNVIRSENMFYSLEDKRDISLLSDIQMEKADIYKKKGNLFSAVETLESVAQGLESQIQQNRSGNLFGIETQLARALVALGNVSEISHTCTTEVIASYYRRAVSLASNFQDGFYYLARFYDRMFQESTFGLVEDGEKQNKKLLPDKNALQNIIQCLSVALENYTSTMELGGTYIFESLPRLLTLWFNFEYQACAEKSVTACAFSEEDMATVRSAMERAFENLPMWQWTTCTSQILSRVSHPSAFVRKNLVQLIARLTVCYCTRMIWYLAPVLNGKNCVRRKAGEKIVSVAEELGGQDVCNTLRSGLAFIQEFSKICLQNTPKHVKKLSFSSNFDAFKKMLPCKQVVIPTKKAIMISYDESLTDRNGSLDSAPAWNPWNEELPTIYGVEDDIILMNSLMKPKRICLVGSDGKQYYFLCKREDSGDMRKDSRLMEFASVINRLLRIHQNSRSRQLTLRTYAVLPLSEECGVIEWLSNLAPLRGIVFHLYNVFGIRISLGEIKEEYERRTCTSLEFYRNWLLPRFPALLRHFFVACFLEPSEWFLAKKRFTYSCAVWSMIGYIVGLGDRHGENILIDMTSGECIHVDFACMFDKGLTLKVPELVPFRLTPNMLDAMGPSGYEGSFRVASQITMSIARANKDCLMSVLETFLYDPLVEWERSVGTKYRSSKEKENIPVERSALKPNAHAVKARQSIDEKLQGIVKDSRSPLSIQGQVQRLLLEATNEENLANMYIWWMAWI
ncbi:hypothetical protein GpartN1_g6224.t1 [Galdieria partita]|uniref:Serine/threonine-protein kinase ATR n=1 Tax=Galdieria partita TaxID=83374 RepID=A0A9C7Q0X2_9RHOD|nr:hypothetical protein GpartN1_g6224.t1 [Galdieria partita]